MFPKNIPLYKLDLSGKNPDNKVTQEYYRRLDLEHDIAFVLRSGPFYTESLVLTQPNGTELIEGTDYEIYGIASDLTAFVKDKEVGMMILMKNQNIGEWFAEYQVVGHFSIINRDLVNMVNGAIDDDRPVLYKNLKNKPLWFNPELHQHDLRYEIHSFTDLIACIKRIKDVKAVLPDRNLVAMDHFHTVILTHIEAYEKMLLKYIAQHDSEFVPPYTNSHGLTAKQVNMELVDNFETATLLDILDGFRKDLHVTADLLKRAVDTIGKETETLVKLGTIPVLRYGSNSFIPSPIQGSFEGMGGTDFNVGVNIETNGDAVMLMNRNDGRVDGLYFMQNRDSKSTVKYDVSKWEFTAHQYTHQTAEADGVTLSKIIRGSDGRFIIVGGTNKSGQTIWYYSLSNGTFDPTKHKLIRVPSDIPINSACFLCTETFPKRILLFRRYTPTETISDSTYRKQGYDLPVDQTSFPGVNLGTAFSGFGVWEFDMSTASWKRVTFNYTHPEETEIINSDVYIPFKTVITEISDSNPRADGKTPAEGYQYGLSAFEFKFAKPISFWDMRAWIDIALGRYDKDTDKLYLKYWYTSYGSDTRASNYESGYSSLGFIFKNRKDNNGVISYDIENRRSLKKVYTLDTTVLGASSQNNIIEEGISLPNYEWVPTGFAGIRTQAWLGSKRLFSIGSASYGTFPLSTTCHDWNGFSSVENYDSWVDDRMNTNLGGIAVPYSSINYNETNPAGLTIGAHSTFWLQLNPSDPDTYGAVSFSNITGKGSTGLWFRKQPVLDSNGYPKAPGKTFNLYEAMTGNGTKTLGYELNNTVYPITNRPETCFVTNIFANSSDNRRSEYIKHLVGHQPFPTGSNAVTNDTAVTKVSFDWEVKADGEGYNISPTKTYDLDDAIKNVLIPYMTARLSSALPSVTVKLSAENALATMRLGFCNLRGTKYNNLMLLSFLVFDDDDDNVNNINSYIVAMTFDISGGSAGSDGVITGANVSPVGNVVGFKFVPVRGDRIKQYARSGWEFNRSAGSIVVTQSRDLVMQLDNGLTHMNMQWDLFLQVKGNNNYPGASFLISENGVIEGSSFSVYWTAGQYYFFHHPYYGLVNRQSLSGHPAQRSSGPSEVGWPYVRNFNTLSDFKPFFDNWVMGNSNYLESAFSIYFNTEQEVILNGRNYTVPASIYNLFDLSPDPRNKTFYVYLDYNGSNAYYNITATPLAEAPSRGLISIVRTNDDSIYEIENYNVFTMNSIRISDTKHGSVIPSATGSIEEQGQIEGWVTNSRT